jgi:hypothetical protein
MYHSYSGDSGLGGGGSKGNDDDDPSWSDAVIVVVVNVRHFHSQSGISSGDFCSRCDDGCAIASAT